MRQYRHKLKKLTTTDGRLYDYSGVPREIRNKIPYLYYFAGMLQILEMAKDFRDTFAPYKTKRHILNDLFFPFAGLLNLLFGALNLFTASVATVLSIPLTFMVVLWQQGPFFAFLSIGYSLYWGVDKIFCGTMQLLRGATSIAATPLVWLRMPLRGIITLCTGWPKFEESDGLKRCLSEGEELLTQVLTEEARDSITQIIKHLNYKAIKAHYRGQGSQLSTYDTLPHVDENTKTRDIRLKEQSNELFESVLTQLSQFNVDGEDNTKKTIRAYFGLFKPVNHPTRSEESAPLSTAHTSE